MRNETSRKQALKALQKTLNLPKTEFPMRANAVKREPLLRKQCVGPLYQWQSKMNGKEFILHDGPPFANGDLHMGHFLNKVLKDIINRYKLMRGFKIKYIPGWDCHGLPIEHKALQQLDAKSLSPTQIRQVSQKLAAKAIRQQRNDFEKWAILADWDHDAIYATMNPDYEAKQLDIFKKMVDQGLIYRGSKPVYWSPSSKTALAESELEYADQHVSIAAYITFPFRNHDNRLAKYEKLSCVIWTTTPWTIPANMALCVHPQVEYSIVQDQDHQHFIVATDLVSDFEINGLNGRKVQIIESFKGLELSGALFTHPFFDRESRILLGDHVTTDAGTGVVHTAPGHGQDDYFVWLQNRGSSELICPVDDEGIFTEEAGSDLVGQSVLDEGNKSVLKKLEQSGRLLHSEKYLHRYPYDWRTKQPVILRATSQWFAKLASLHEASHSALEDVEMVPKSARRRLEATLSSRDEWCISRQRAWGLPIPVFYHLETQEALMNQDTISHIQNLIQEHGSKCWWEMSIEELLPPSYRHLAGDLRKGLDTLDVWFDSGSSWYAVLDQEQKTSKPHASDVYLEGSDQHRGWFQSSLLTAMAMGKASPYKTLVTHGFVLDENNRKMSKSLGNVIVPRDLIEGTGLAKKTKAPAYGVDVLRFWVAGTDYTSDVNIGMNVISKVSDQLRKVRNTARFLLGNLNDYNRETDAIDYDNLPELEQYMLHLLHDLNMNVTEAYDTFSLSRAQSVLAYFISTDLSSFYMEACKDRLYCDPVSSFSRRACQTVLDQALEALTKSIAPVVCHTAQDIYNHTQHYGTKSECESVFQTGWIQSQSKWKNTKLAIEWEMMRNIRAEINKAVEDVRNAKHIGSPMEVDVELIIADQKLWNMLERMGQSVNMADVFLCSTVTLINKTQASTAVEDLRFHHHVQVTLSNEEMPLEISIKPAKGHKCPRCWKYTSLVDENTLCPRCEGVTGISTVTAA